ncbi:NUDIX hydrolase [Sphaerisporangium rubeum]|uniref:8-oxo-dGTP pyrophosphatase MutT (NUDIX family) n=1 Tax=Sphaerisporangium rubeum TaxID=321317 RepID=A0A7X0M5P0_9ACTN|nr:NUDIX hydrolase [Sphaerisporangium rubeum]MBB6471154.1 8-oxo-dGTP pyrophosphatase MutT (NUDIX family) [Sphaerisporangium rubeum]
MTHLPADVFYARLNKNVAAAGALITDPEGRVLLVKPNYRDHWGWPGGHVDEHETPDQACAREVTEEVGLTLPVGRLLVVHWVAPYDDRPIPLIHFLFDCGQIPTGEQIILQEEELDEYRFFPPAEAADLLPAHLARRLLASLTARSQGTTIYLT